MFGAVYILSLNLIYETAIKEAKPLPDFTGSDSFFVKLTIPGKIIDSRMLTLIKQIDNERLESMTTDDYVLLSMLFQKQDVVDVRVNRFANLLKLGIVRKTELGIELAEENTQSAVNRRSIGGQSAESADKAPIKGNGITQQITQQIMDSLSSNGTATSSQLSEITGLSQRRVREILNDLIRKGLIAKVGNYRHTSYVLKNGHE